MFQVANEVVTSATGSSALRPRSKGASLDRFLSSKDGTVGLMFGLMFTVMVLFVAGALDLSRWLAARTDTLAAVDSAVLAGGRSLQTKADDPAAAVAVAQRYYEENTRNITGIEDQVQFVTAQNNTAVRAQGNAFIQTPFLNVVGIPRLPLIKASEGEFAEAVVAAGGNSQTNVEISLMLDITGSMCQPCQKLADLKLAAKDLIDIVVWQDQSKFTSRVALVPFSEAIAIDSNWAAEVVSNGPQKYTFKDRSNKNKTYNLDPRCATERTGANAFTDATPNDQDKLGHFYDSDGECKPTTGSVIPLSSNKTTLKAAIDAYEASGGTAGHLGTAWAWYMLSPEWEQRVPPASRPAPYSMLSELNARGGPKLRKIAILMTDGEYNTQYCNGVKDSVIKCSSPNGSSNIQARTLCANMKAKGITVYTVGFQMPEEGESVTTLQQCATDATKYYNVENGDALRQAFRDIALQISTLHLTK